MQNHRVRIRFVTENNGSLNVFVKEREEANKLVKEMNNKANAGATIQRKDIGIHATNWFESQISRPKVEKR